MNTSRSLVLPRPLLAVLLLSSACAAVAADIQLPLVPFDAHKTIRASRPESARAAANRPASITKLPEDLVQPTFGQFKFGPKESPMTITFAFDDPPGKAGRLFIDANGNGDLTDDPAPEWAMSDKERNGKAYRYGEGSAMLYLKKGDEASKVRVKLYRYVGSEPSMRGDLQYYPDYARIGKVELDGKSYGAILHDEAASGDYRHSAASVLLDLNGDGRFDFRTENFQTRNAFKVGETVYEVTGVAADGSTFQIVKSTRPLPERKAPAAPVAAVQPGQPAPKFEATTITGQKISFPDSYKGKLVLLDFWATWCGPCISELPNLIKAHETHHARGLEVLGISLDSERTKDTLPEFLKSRNMTWPQVCDGKSWDAQIGRQYGVRAIPAAFLVDGTTGIVLATQGLRGAQLSRTIEDALAGKLKPKAAAGAAPANNLIKEGEARQEAGRNHMFEMAALAQKDHEGALKQILDGLRHDPLKHAWGMEVAVIYKLDERRAQTLKGEERTKHFAQCRDYLLRAQTLLQDALKKHPGDSSLTYGLGSVDEALAVATLGAGDTAKARELALGLLAANTNPADWNYGNIIHEANCTLGRAALREGDKKAAAEFLKKAGDTPGSPQLNSFGPDWTFAREIIEAGETQAVLDYFDLVEKFWVSRKNPKSRSAKLADAHQQKLDQWRADVRAGKVPDFKP